MKKNIVLLTGTREKAHRKDCSPVDNCHTRRTGSPSTGEFSQGENTNKNTQEMLCHLEPEIPESGQAEKCISQNYITKVYIVFFFFVIQACNGS